MKRTLIIGAALLSTVTLAGCFGPVEEALKVGEPVGQIEPVTTTTAPDVTAPWLPSTGPVPPPPEPRPMTPEEGLIQDQRRHHNEECGRLYPEGSPERDTCNFSFVYQPPA